MIVLGHEHFDFPIRRRPAMLRYAGTPIDDASSEPWTPPWPADDKRPLVLVSLSTLPQGQATVMQQLVQAVGELPVRALVTLGPSLNSDDFTLAPNTVAESFIPHSAVMPLVDAMVTQCGLGTLTKALRNGIPLVCLPLVGDQPDNAARIVAQGAGTRLPRNASKEQIKAAIIELLSNASYRESAQRLARAMRATSPEDNAARELEDIAQTARMSPT
jgi:UDP:flavonoid glycosyltransferase YjiC (YdhE family)